MRITIIVNHPTIHDGRVLKTAYSLANLGNEVTLIDRAGLASVKPEPSAGLTFVTVPYLSPVQFLRSFFGVSSEPKSAIGAPNSVEELSALPSGFKWIKRFLGGHLRDFWVHLECKYATKLAILNSRPDILHANDLDTLLAAVHAKKHAGCKVVYDAHEIAVEEYPGMPMGSRWWRSFQERRQIKKVDAVLTTGEDTALYLIKRYGLSDIGIVYNSPGVIDPAEHGGLRQACGLSSDVPLAVFTGYLRPDRGMMEILHAVSLVHDLHFARVGPARADLDDLLAEHSQKLGIEQRVHNLDAVDPMQTAAFIQDADFALIVNRNFSTNVDLALPNKLFDALLANVPLIVGRQRAVSRLAQEEGVCVVVDETDPNSIAEGIRRLMSEREFYRYDENAADEIAENYSWDSQVRTIEQTYVRISQDKTA
jgi:glycosyltransferase involved in cell wall biosynthesis